MLIKQFRITQNKSIYKMIYGFTLAEVLITIGIIGIVASMVIPAITNGSEKQSTASKVKEIYSIILQATNQIAGDCGGAITNCLTSPDASGNQDSATTTEILNLYLPKLSVAKVCTNHLDCVSSTYQYINCPGQVWNNTNATWTYIDGTTFVLANGMTLVFQYRGTSNPPKYITFFVDLNGTKGPNQWGKDFFEFLYVKASQKVIPYNFVDALGSCTAACSSASQSLGYDCSRNIIMESNVNYY